MLGLQPIARLRVVRVGDAARYVRQQVMPDPEHSEISLPDAVQLFRSFARVAESSQRLVLDFLTRAPEFSGLRMADRRVGEAFLELTAKMLSDPVALARAQIDLWTEHARLWTAIDAKSIRPRRPKRR